MLTSLVAAHPRHREREVGRISHSEAPSFLGEATFYAHSATISSADQSRSLSRFQA